MYFPHQVHRTVSFYSYPRLITLPQLIRDKIAKHGKIVLITVSFLACEVISIHIQRERMWLEMVTQFD